MWCSPPKVGELNSTVSNIIFLCLILKASLFSVFLSLHAHISLSSPHHSLLFSPPFLIYLYPFLSSFYLLFPPALLLPSYSLSLIYLLSCPSPITIPSQVGEQISNGRKCAGCLTCLQLTVLWYLLENLITVTLHATVPFMGCLFIKRTPLRQQTWCFKEARPAPVRWEGISSFPGTPGLPYWSPRPPPAGLLPLSPFSGILSHFSNCLYDIQNLLGINGLCINIPIHFSEYLWVYFLEEVNFLGRTTVNTWLPW